MIFIQRNTAPLKSNKYYGLPDPFITSGFGMFQNGGNCTDYGYCRYREAQEDMSASDKLPTSNAYNWYEEAKRKGFKVGTTPKRGAIAVFGNPKKKKGHIAFVEDVVGNYVLYSSSAWKKYIFKTKKLKIGAAWGIGLPLIGYIYPNVEFEENLPITGDYKVISPRYVRKGAGIEFDIKKVKDLTKDGQKHCTSKNPNAKAQYQSGTIFTNQKTVKAKNGSIWAKTPSGFVCLVSSKGTMYCSKA